MTVSVQTNRTSVVGTEAEQEIPFTFPITSTSDITVYKRLISSGEETKLDETADYTVTIDGTSGGTVTTVTPFIADTYQIHIIRDTPMTQTLDLVQGGPFNAENIETALDKSVRLIIENSNSLDRTLRFPETDAASIIQELPDAPTRAGKFLYFGADGNPSVAESITTGETTISPFGKDLIDDASASAALTTLGFTPYGKTLIDDTSAAIARGTLGLDTDDNVEFAKITGTDIIPKSPWIDVRAYSAVADGTTDTTTFLQNAINAANSGVVKRVYFPAGVSYYKITSELTFYGGIEYFGDGINSQIRQVTSNSNVLAASSQDDFSIHDLYLYGLGDTSGGTNGIGIYLSNCDRAKIYNVKCENMGLHGINLRNSNYGSVKNNFVTGSGKDTTSSTGIYISYSSSYNLIEGNIITNDRHGIGVQAVDTGDYASYNIIIGNRIKTCDRYGIMLYSPADAYVYGNRIIGNIIRDISDVTATDFGAGIYSVGSRYTTIADNYIENTNQGTTTGANLAPGGIGVISSFNCEIVGNTIYNTQWYGITVRAAAGVGSHITVSNNDIHDSTLAGIDVRGLDNVIVSNNLIRIGDKEGISCVGSTPSENLLIANNSITGINDPAITVSGYDHVRITGNVASGSVTTYGIIVATSNYISILNNTCNDNVYGILIPSTNTYVTVHNNTCVGNDYGISGATATNIIDFKDNIVTGSGTDDWTNGPYSTLATGEATPSVKGGRYFLTAGTTTITDFDDPYIGQEIIILAVTSITITDGTNIFLNGSANFDMNDSDTLTLICKADLKWYETGRSDNT